MKSTLMLTLASERDWLTKLWLKPGNSDLSPSVDGLFMFIMWVCIISFVALMVPMCYWAWRWRRKPGVPPIRTPNHNTFLEISWVVGPLIVVTFIFFWGFYGYMNTQVAKGNAINIDVTGYKWNWDVLYPNGAGSGQTVYLDDLLVTKPGETQKTGQRGNAPVKVIVVPEGVPVKFQLKSKDVMHSFYIPDMRLKMDLFPNRYTSMTFTPQNSDPALSAAGSIGKKPGEKGRDHYIFCAEYCGTSHSEMAAILRVLPMDEYMKTVEEWGNMADKLSLVDVGKYVHAQRCATCHSVDGSAGTGPSWKGFYLKPVPLSVSTGQQYDFSKEEDWNSYILESINYPNAKIHAGYAAGQMPSFLGQLKERELAGVVAYFRELAGKATDEDRKTPEPKQ